MNRKDVAELILSSFSNSPYKWRTARGVAKQTGISIQQVVDYFERSDKFIRAKKPNKSGQALYTSKQQYKKETPLYRRLIAAITNEPDV